MARDDITYLHGYRALRVQRQAEISRLYRQLADFSPLPRFLLGVFLFVLGSTFFMILPPLGGIFLAVGLVCGGSGVKLLAVRLRVKREISDEEFRWNLRDTALAKLGETEFETLGSAVEARGSYASVSAWLLRKNLARDEMDALILAAAAAAEERVRIRTMAATRATLAPAIETDADAVAARQHGAAFGHRSENDPDAAPTDTASEEGLHARLLREADAEQEERAPPTDKAHNDDAPGEVAPPLIAPARKERADDIRRRFD